LWTYQLLLRRFPTTDGSAAAMRRDVQAFSKPSSPTTRSRGSRTLLMMYRQLSTAFGKLPCNLIFATGRPSVGKVAAQESTVWPERKLGVIIVSYGMSLATTGERPNGINADCYCFAPAAKISIELSTTAEFPRRGRPAASRALKSDQYLSRRRSSQLFLSLRPAFPRAGGVIPNPNRAFDPAIESNQAQRTDRHHGHRPAERVFHEYARESGNAVSTFGTTIGGAFQPTAK
jgi:hypothetical protein